MQKEIDAMGAPADIAILGVNQLGHERANATACEGKDLPWLQETPEELVWSRWEVAYRDVVILDRDNVRTAVYNLTEHDLADPANYEALKALLLGGGGNR
jgi:hypothetical protein